MNNNDFCKFPFPLSVPIPVPVFLDSSYPDEWAVGRDGGGKDTHKTPFTVAMGLRSINYKLTDNSRTPERCTDSEVN